MPLSSVLQNLEVYQDPNDEIPILDMYPHSDVPDVMPDAVASVAPTQISYIPSNTYDVAEDYDAENSMPVAYKIPDYDVNPIQKTRGGLRKRRHKYKTNAVNRTTKKLKSGKNNILVNYGRRSKQFKK
jgi:hypothetical protein